MGYVIAFIVLGVMTVGTFVFALSVSKNEAMLKKRLEELNLDSDGLDEVSKRNIEDLPLRERIFYPYIMRMSKLMMRFTPQSYINRMNEKMVLAGNPKGMTASELIGIQGLFGIILPLFLCVFLTIMGTPFVTVIMLFIMFAGFGMVLPSFFLGKAITKRQDEVRKRLPFTLDLLTVSVDAGLGFDSAMDKVAETMDGPIPEEFNRVLTEIRIGKSRKEALRNMITRTEVKELSQFVVAIIQADRLGVGLSKLLKVQSKQMRMAAKQRAQEKAFKAPVKMLFPMILFIFPSIFVILLGPAILYLPQVFANM